MAEADIEPLQRAGPRVLFGQKNPRLIRFGRGFH
jgi:hypothetical protein